MSNSIHFIVNPQSQGGRTGKTWESQFAVIKSALDGYDIDYIVADGIGKGVEATLEAVNAKFDTVISVGGEGTANEVVNGIMQATNGHQPTLGFIRSGTVNDYLRAISWPTAVEDQIELIRRGQIRKTPVVKISGETKSGTVSKYGLNVADIGVGATIAHMASVQRKLTWIRSALRYQLLSVRAVLGWKNLEADVDIDGEVIAGQLSLLTAGFSPYSGAYHLHPHADTHGEKMAYTMGMNFSRLDMIKKMGMLQKGEHTPEMENIYMGHAQQISISTTVPTLFEVDGEPFREPADKVEIVACPSSVNVLTP